VNLGSGREISISALADEIAKLVGFQGAVRWDTTKPSGQPRRRLDVHRAYERFGFRATTTLDEGLAKTYAWMTRGT
jgi:GDP-L-fucose synthase